MSPQCSFRRLVCLLAVLAPVGAWAQDRGIDPARLPGIVVDDASAKLIGTWEQSKVVRPFVGTSYIHSPGGAGQRVEFSVELVGLLSQNLKSF